MTTLPTRPKFGRTSLVCRALKILILKTPDNSCARQCRALILVEKTPETSTGAYVGRNLCAKEASAPDFRASKILKSSARQLRPKVGRVGRVVTYVNWNFEWEWTLFKLMDYMKQYTVESGKMLLDTFPILSRPWQFVGKIETVAYLTANKKKAGYYWLVITLAVVSLPTNCLMSVALSKRSIDEGNMHHCLFWSFICRKVD